MLLSKYLSAYIINETWVSFIGSCSSWFLTVRNKYVNIRVKRRIKSTMVHHHKWEGITHMHVDTSACSTTREACQHKEGQRRGAISMIVSQRHSSNSTRAAALMGNHYPQLWLFIAPVQIIYHMNLQATISRDISIIIIKSQKDDQWLIRNSHIGPDFAKCFTIDDRLKSSLTWGNDDSNVNKAKEKMQHS